MEHFWSKIIAWLIGKSLALSSVNFELIMFLETYTYELAMNEKSIYNDEAPLH